MIPPLTCCVRGARSDQPGRREPRVEEPKVAAGGGAQQVESYAGRELCRRRVTQEESYAGGVQQLRRSATGEL